MAVKTLAYYAGSIIVLAVTAIAGASESPANRAAFAPALGRYYRPGAWLRVRAYAEIPPQTRGLYAPAVEVLPQAGDSPVFSSHHPPQPFAGGEVFSGDFWLMAGDEPPRLRFALYDGDAVAFATEPVAGILQPAEPGRRIILCLAASSPAPRATHVAETSPQTLPGHAALYESVDIIVAGDISGRTLPLPDAPYAFAALAEWLAGGGAMLVFDRPWGERIERALAERGWPRLPKTPFILASESGVAELPPMALRIGSGWLVFCESGAAGGRALAGHAIWEKLRRSCLRPAPADYRLWEGRAADPAAWPPPRLPESDVFRWLAIWLILLAGSLAAMRFWPRLRLAAWPAAAVSALISCLMAAAIHRQLAMPEANVFTVQVKNIGETGMSGPAREDEIRVISPFGDSEQQKVFFRSLPPPRLCAANARDLAGAYCEMHYDEDRGEGKMVISSPHLARRWRPFICRSSRLGKAEPEMPLLCHAGDVIRLEALADDRRALRDVLVCTPRSAGAAALLGPLRRGTISACDRAFAGLPAPRRHFLELMAAERTAGYYATLLGWKEISPRRERQEIFLGTLHVQGLKLLPLP